MIVNWKYLSFGLFGQNDHLKNVILGSGELWGRFFTTDIKFKCLEIPIQQRKSALKKEKNNQVPGGSCKH